MDQPTFGVVVVVVVSVRRRFVPTREWDDERNTWWYEAIGVATPKRSNANDGDTHRNGLLRID